MATGPGAAVRRQVLSYRWSAISLAAFAVLMAALFWWQLPTSFARAFGAATEVTATVQEVQLAGDQPRKKRHGPVWSVSLRWADPVGQDGTRTGAARVKSDEVPFATGDRVSAFVIDGSETASLGVDTDDAGTAWLMLGLCVFMIVVALCMLHGTKRWKKLLRVPSERDPARVRVVRVIRTKDGYGVDYRPISGVRLPNSLGLIKRGRLTPPEPAEVLEVWPLGADGSGPLLVRQVENESWWAGSGSLH